MNNINHFNKWLYVVGGAILIMDILCFPDKTGPELVPIMDVTMMCEMQGKERNEEEFKNLLGRAGFINFIAIRLPNALYFDAIVAFKK